ncbi:hypothetical protein [Blastomonas sp.]|uniref:hypothetical protein n=1 Tax=Blastomonas sp. TaxID=1909299 RepID=UPI00391C1A04
MNEAEYRVAVQAARKAWIPLQVFRGRDYVLTLRFRNVDYSAAAIAAEVRNLPDSAGDPLLSFTVGTPVYSGGDTLIPLNITDSETGGVPAAAETGLVAKFYWDIKITVGGLVDTIAAGPVQFIGRVTA